MTRFLTQSLTENGEPVEMNKFMGGIMFPTAEDLFIFVISALLL